MGPAHLRVALLSLLSPHFPLQTGIYGQLPDTSEGWEGGGEFG